MIVFGAIMLLFAAVFGVVAHVMKVARTSWPFEPGLSDDGLDVSRLFAAAGWIIGAIGASAILMALLFV